MKRKCFFFNLSDLSDDQDQNKDIKIFLMKIHR